MVFEGKSNGKGKCVYCVRGGVSPVIANLALDGLERLLREHYPTNTKQSSRAKVNLIRYADNILITGSSRHVLEEEIIPLMTSFLQQRGLTLSPTKTRITQIADGLDFLGQNLRKYHGKLLIQPARQNVRAFLQKVRGIVKAHPTATAGSLIV